MPSRDLVRLNRALRTQAERSAKANGTDIRAGRVVSLDASARVAQVRLDGQNTTASVGWLGGSAPAIGDAVHVLVQGGAMTVLTGVHGTTSPTQTTIVDGGGSTDVSQVYKTKTIDELHSSTTTPGGTNLRNDAHLFFPIDVSETWLFELVLYFEGDTAGDLKVGFTAPAGATGRWGFEVAPDPTATGVSPAVMRTGTTTDFTAPTPTTFNIGTVGAGVGCTLRISGVVTNSTTAGNLQLVWGQRSSFGTATKLLQRSFLRGEKVGAFGGSSVGPAGAPGTAGAPGPPGYSNVVVAADYGAVGDNIVDDTTALRNARVAATQARKPLWLQGISGTHFKITSTLDWAIDQPPGEMHVYGPGQQKCVIHMHANNTPIMTIAGHYNELDGFSLVYETRQRTVTHTNSTCLLFTNSPNGMAHSRFANLQLVGGNYGIGMTPGSGNSVFSCTFDNILIDDFASVGFEINGGGTTGQTGCVINNLRVTNVNGAAVIAGQFPARADSVLAAAFAVRLLDVTECVFNQLNVEWAALDAAMEFLDCGEIVVNSFHGEGLVGKADGYGFFHTGQRSYNTPTPGTRLVVNGAHFMTIRINPTNWPVTNYALFRPDGYNDALEVHGVSETDYAGSSALSAPTVSGSAKFRRLNGGPNWINESARFTTQQYLHLNDPDFCSIPVPGGSQSGDYEGRGRAHPMVRQDNDRHPHLVGGTAPFAQAAPPYLAVDAKHGFFYLPKINGTPTGTPADEGSGLLPMAFNRVTNELAVYHDSAWDSIGGGSTGVYDVSKMATSGTGVYDASKPAPFFGTWAGWEAELNAVPQHSLIYFPPGLYWHTAQIRPKIGWNVFGGGMRSSFVRFIGTNAPLMSGWMPATDANGGWRGINRSIDTYFRMRDISIFKNGGLVGQVGANFEDLCGTGLSFERVEFGAAKYGLILDQTECSHITECTFGINAGNGQLACIWLVDGDDHWQSESGGPARYDFTNQITVSKCRFQGPGPTSADWPNTFAIIDDGGMTRVYQDNNFDGFETHIRLNGTINCNIRGGEYEGSSGPPIKLCSTRYNGLSNTGAGYFVFSDKNRNTTIEGGMIGGPTGSGCVDIADANAAGQLVSINNRFVRFDAFLGEPAITGVGFLQTFNDIGSGTSAVNGTNFPLVGNRAPKHSEGFAGTVAASPIGNVNANQIGPATETTVISFPTFSANGLAKIRLVFDFGLYCGDTSGAPIPRTVYIRIREDIGGGLQYGPAKAVRFNGLAAGDDYDWHHFEHLIGPSTPGSYTFRFTLSWPSGSGDARLHSNSQAAIYWA